MILPSSFPSVPLVQLSEVKVTLPGPTGPVTILKGVNLYLHPGETVSLVGPSGSGKSTLMMVVAGLEKATAGSVRVAGHDLTTLDEDRLARFRQNYLGIVFQAFHLIPTMTALENVAIPLELAGRHDALKRAEENLCAVGLEERLAHYPAQLSGGEQQRVALARAFAGEPPLLLADEPTGNLDEKTGKIIIDLLFDLADRRRTTLLLITHDPALAERCQRQAHMRDGCIDNDTSPSHVPP